MEVMERQAEMIRSFVAVDRRKKSVKSCFSSIYGSIYHSVSDPDPNPLHLAGSGSTSIPAPDPLRFLSSDPDPLKKALIWIRVALKLFRVIVI